MTDTGIIAGQVVLVTGAARGLGAACVEVLAEAGAEVVAVDRNVEGAGAVVDAVQRRGGHAAARPLDVTDAEAAEAAVRAVAEEYGQLDAIVNAAGVDVTLPADELPVEEWRRIVDVNLNGPYFISRAALPVMREQGGGSIVNIASTASKRAWANASAYHASKWGLLGLSYALHAEARAYGVRVTALVSGGMHTPFLTERFPDIDTSTLQDPHHVARAIEFVLSQPEGVAIPELLVMPMRETSWP